MAQQVQDTVKKQRVHRLIDLAGRMSTDYRQRYQGTKVPVLWETRRDGETWEGLTDTYVRVRARSEADLVNRIVPARIAGLSEDGLVGEVTA
jgi:threonylcarbamoyladenosine tRNA methylthiotransferase MtaB